MLKPQDIPILLKTDLWQDRQWRYSDLAKSIGMSESDGK
jgi:DNA-binding Xre family transcriptional regulator